MDRAQSARQERSSSERKGDSATAPALRMARLSGPRAALLAPHRVESVRIRSPAHLAQSKKEDVASSSGTPTGDWGGGSMTLPSEPYS